MSEVISYTMKEINDIIESESFKDNLIQYKQNNTEKIDNLQHFVNSVRENKTYLRFASSRKDENLKKEEIFLKQINSIFNKLTEKTKPQLIEQIYNILRNNPDYKLLFFKDILFKCIDNYMNCQLYSKCINELSSRNIKL